MYNIRRLLLSLGLSRAAPGTAQREAITNDFGRMPAPQPCPAKPVHVMSLIVAACLHRSLAQQSPCMSCHSLWPHACTAALPAEAGACHSLRRFESAVCQASNAPRGLGGSEGAALLAKAGACHSLGVSKAPFASPQTLLGSSQRRWPGSQPLPRTFGVAKPLAGTFGRCFALAKPVRVTL